MSKPIAASSSTTAISHQAARLQRQPNTTPVVCTTCSYLVPARTPLPATYPTLPYKWPRPASTSGPPANTFNLNNVARLAADGQVPACRSKRYSFVVLYQAAVRREQRLQMAETAHHYFVSYAEYEIDKPDLSSDHCPVFGSGDRSVKFKTSSPLHPYTSS
jgi:hypothetical protein